MKQDMPAVALSPIHEMPKPEITPRSPWPMAYACLDGRGGQRHLYCETKSRMWPDARHFHLTARLDAYENDTVILQRDMIDINCTRSDVRPQHER
ncbi:hypothetical protein SAMN04488092_10595 [Thalassovita taeanensis]|uniref:Uncharacterized protein n=1 Tax=Thalassovita taeanensis TaxID=657014 RepID=A0A1H9ELQ6_9RHOB|nr:hypothetical protein SAMN04488092_10595 [Thalassovita taeanensis]